MTTPLPTRDELLKRLLIRAATSPASLFLGTSGLLLLPSPETWAAGIGLLAANAALVWRRVRDPRQARASSEEMLRGRWRAQINRLEEITPALDRETASALASIVDSEERLIALYGGEPAAIPPSRVELTTLLEHCLTLAEKRQQLQGYLAGSRPPEIQRQVQQLQLKAEKSPDSLTRQLYTQAIDQKRQELENLARLQEAVERIDGQLAAVQCTFDNMVGKIVRLRSAETVTSDTAADPFHADLQRLTQGVTSLEESLNEILALRGER